MGKGQSPPLIRPIRPNRWADLAASHASTSQGPSRSSSRDARRSEPGELSSVSLLLRQASSCEADDPTTAELFKNAATRLLQQHASSSMPKPTKPKSADPQLDGQHQKVANLKNQCQQATAKADRLYQQAQQQLVAAQSKYSQYEEAKQNEQQLASAHKEAEEELSRMREELSKASTKASPVPGQDASAKSSLERLGISTQGLKPSLCKDLEAQINTMLATIAATIAEAKEQQQQDTALREGLDLGADDAPMPQANGATKRNRSPTITPPLSRASSRKRGDQDRSDRSRSPTPAVKDGLEAMASKLAAAAASSETKDSNAAAGSSG